MRERCRNDTLQRTNAILLARGGVLSCVVCVRDAVRRVLLVGRRGWLHARLCFGTFCCCGGGNLTPGWGSACMSRNRTGATVLCKIYSMLLYAGPSQPFCYAASQQNKPCFARFAASQQNKIT